MAENINFELKVTKDQLGEALEKDTKLAKGLGNTLEVAIGAFAAGAALKGLSLLGDGFRSLTNFVGDSVSAAAEAETSQTKLQIALAQTGKLTDENVKSFNAFATQLQATTAFEDDAIISSAALIQSLASLDSDGLQRATEAAANLAATFNTDLESASRIVGKAAEGNTVALQKLGIEFTKGATDAETFANVLSVLEGRFGGAAQAQAKTFAGALAQLSNIWGDLKENVGAVIVQNPAVIAAFKVLSGLIITVGQSISSAFSGDGQSLAGAFRLILDGANAVVLSIDAVIRVFNILANIVVGSFETIKAAILAPATAILNLLALVPGIGDTFKEAAAKSSADFNKLADTVQQRTNDIKESFTGESFLSGVSGQIADVRNNFDVLYNEIKNKSTDLKNNPVTIAPVEDPEQLARINEANIALLEAQKGFYIAKDQLALEDQIAEDERFFARTTAQITQLNDFELQKSEIQYQAAIERAKLLATVEERAIATQKATLDKEIRNQKITQKTKADIRSQEISDQAAFFSAATSLASSSNKSLAAIGKAAALVEIGINTQKSASSSFAFGSKIGGPALGATFAAIAVAAGTAQAAKVAGIQGFAEGGIVSGSSTQGDKIPVNVNSKEMILNQEQQANLFDMIKTGGSSGDIIIQIDGRTIARAVRDQVRTGFVLA